MTPEQIHSVWQDLTPEEQDELRKGLDTQLREQNILLQQQLEQFANCLGGLRAVQKSSHKGRVKCLVCLSEGRLREFSHLASCLWAKLQEYKRQHDAARRQAARAQQQEQELPNVPTS